MLSGKTVVLGVSGSIAAYKIADLASMLVKQHADVHVVMTENATHFIHPITFETLTHNPCLTDTFDRSCPQEVTHIALAARADVCLLAPASANILGKLANGIADDMLSTTCLAMKCPVLVSPAMNVNMYEHPAVQHNLQTLKARGVEVIEPDSGYLACGAVGKGKLPGVQVLLDHILRAAAKKKDLSGKRVLITAGPTRESIDPVRFISNHSTGKMGYAVAKMAALRDAAVTLVSGPVSLAPPPFVEVVGVTSAQEMQTQHEKMKKKDGEGISIPLRRTVDILQWLGAHKREGQLLCGFSMETQDVLENSRLKLHRKNADLIAANSIRDAGSGFGTDTNHLILITRDGTVDLPLLSKEEAADRLLDELLGLRG